MPAHAVRVLLLGGVANLVLSFALGWLLSMKRMKEPAARHHWLLVAHTVSLQEGLLLVALSWAIGFAALSSTTAAVGAWLLVVASLFQDASGIANWLTRTDDQFAARSSGWVLASINAVLNTAGLAIVSCGVVRGLL